MTAHDARVLGHRTLLYALVALCATLTLLPYAWMLSSSFKPNIEIFSAAIQFIPRITLLLVA